MIGYIFIIFCIAGLITLLYWTILSYSFYRFKPDEIVYSGVYPGVSIIISYKNAKDHISATIQSILNQNYSKFEIIAINDFSNDGGEERLQAIKDKRLRLKKAHQNSPGKKSALTDGISLSHYDLLLFTDADCIPSSPFWIKSMVDTLLSDSKNDMVLGYSPLISKPGLLNLFVRYETFLTAFQYFGFALLKIPYMGVGRNIMYRKSLFYSTNGFSSHANVISGDDDLFVNDAAYMASIAVNTDPKSFVYSQAKSTLKSYLVQKSRHISTSIHYRTRHRILLTLFALSHMTLYLILISACFSGLLPLEILAGILLLKWTIQTLLHFIIMEKMKVADIAKWFPLMDVLTFLFYITVPVFSLFNKDEW
ncbi:MAG: glycosyltransferase [Saprospiraceae bacterium]|nr:glycosyltransferase [Saprospiraceae bacterium]